MQQLHLQTQPPQYGNSHQPLLMLCIALLLDQLTKGLAVLQMHLDLTPLWDLDCLVLQTLDVSSNERDLHS